MILNVQKELMPTYLELSQQLRKAGLRVLTSFEQRSLGKQIQAADKQGIPFCVIVGSQELAAQKCGLKNLKTGEQTEVEFDQLAAAIEQQIR
jgi:histidyl-tRNA synthetase